MVRPVGCHKVDGVGRSAHRLGIGCDEVVMLHGYFRAVVTTGSLQRQMDQTQA